MPLLSLDLKSTFRCYSYLRRLCSYYTNSVLTELSQQYQVSVRTLQTCFDKVIVSEPCVEAQQLPINLLLDATFFSRRDGVLILRADRKNLHRRFIETESLSDVAAGFDVLDKQGHHFKSVTIDGRKGVIGLIQARYPGVPIQMCQFHQAMIIRRYTTNRPKTECGKALKIVMRQLTLATQDVFASLVNSLREEYDDFLKERNEQGQFKHRQLRSAFRSLKTNLPYLFTYQQYPELNIPNTTNSCDGSFAHWKQKVKIHRGLPRLRRNKMIDFLLNQP